MRLSPAQAGKLAQLALGKSLPKSQIPRLLLKQLQDGQVVKLEQSGSSYVVRGIPGKLERFAEHQWGIRDLERFSDASPERRSRTMLRAAGAQGHVADSPGG
jgi:hypothetical protein